MVNGLSWFNRIASLLHSPTAIKIIDVLKMTKLVEEEGASMVFLIDCYLKSVYMIVHVAIFLRPLEQN